MNRQPSTQLEYRFETLGRSILGAPLQWIAPSSGRCQLLIIAGMHGEEADTTSILSRALRSMHKPLSDTIGIVLCANPDGGMLGTRGNANGVDLNRNYPTLNWQSDPASCRWFFDQAATAIPILTGSAPGSEPETQIMIELVERVQPEMLLSLHGPIGCIDDPDRSEAACWLARHTGLPLVEEIGYATPGSMGSWAAERKLPIITWEFPCEAMEILCRSQMPALVEVLEGCLECFAS